MVYNNLWHSPRRCPQHFVGQPHFLRSGQDFAQFRPWRRKSYPRRRQILYIWDRSIAGLRNALQHVRIYDVLCRSRLNPDKTKVLATTPHLRKKASLFLFDGHPLKVTRLTSSLRPSTKDSMQGPERPTPPMAGQKGPWLFGHFASAS